MQSLLQYGGIGSGHPGDFLVAIVALVGIPITILVVGRLFERLF